MKRDTVHAPPSEAVLGPTATYLLRERPCRIVIESDNRLRRGGGSSAAESNGRPAATAAASGRT